MVRYHIIVHGEVQGVGFRFFSQMQAMNHNVHGWVRNKPDGTVEIEAEGHPEAMDRFLTAIKEGSGFSQVAHVETVEIGEPKQYKSFQIKY